MRAEVHVLTHRVGEQCVGLLVVTEAVEEDCPEAIGGTEVDPTGPHLKVGQLLKDLDERPALFVGANRRSDLTAEGDNDRPSGPICFITSTSDEECSGS